jgi:acetylglutamate kinase
VSGVRVYKLGGPALEDAALLPALARELRASTGPVVVVHGGGRHVDRMLRALGLESRFVDGRRETSEPAMEVVEMVLSGLVNKAVAAGLTAAGVPAVGISGRDGGLMEARLEPGLGRVGIPEAVDPAPLSTLWEAGLLPVVSPVSAAPDGGAVNVNADEAALALARRLRADSMVYLSDVDGVRAGDATLESLSAGEARRHIDEGTITGGMSLKVRMALQAAEAGVGEVVVAGRARLEGRFPGTRILAGQPGLGVRA